MNIQLQCCGLVIIALLLFFFFNQRRVGLFSEQIFLHTIGIAGLSLSLDALSVVAIMHSGNLPAVFVHAVCKAYAASLVWATAQALFYVLTDLYSEKEYLKIIFRIRILVIINSIIIFVLPIHIYKNGTILYTYGPSILATYIFALLYMIASIVCVVRYRHSITRNRRVAVIIWMSLWVAAAVIQFLNNQLLLVGFACALGMMALYLKLENPESNIDRQYGCFHAHALTQYLDQCYERKQSQSILFISTVRALNNDSHSISSSECIEILTNWLTGFPKAKVFKSNEPELVVVFPDMTEMTRIYQLTQDKFWTAQTYMEEEDRLVDNENLLPVPLVGLIPDIMIVKNSDELYQLLQYLRIENNKAEASSVFYVNDMILKAMLQRDEMKESIINALDEDRVEVFYQPIYSTKQGKFVSAEALARIRNKDEYIIPPGLFIPIAEETGLIAPLGERVFEKVCEFLKSSDVTSLGISYIEVNLSVVQCQDRCLADRYIRIMEKYQVKPWQINLEITESASVQTKNILLENMKQLIDYGVSFSLDDFGIGQSNLDYVIEMPVSIMKFDMNMTQAYFTNLKAQFVMQAAIHMAHGMDLFLVAEGVEEESQLEQMKKEGIDYIQGYYFSKPLPQNEFLGFLAAHA